MEDCREIHVDAYTDAVGHAHPPFTADVPKDKTGRLQDLVRKVALDVELRGLANEDLPPAYAPVIPRVRRSTFTEDAVQHLDIVSCWKGLSKSQVLELATWEHLFKECLASQLKQCLEQDFAERLGGYLDPENEALLIPRIVDFLGLEEPLLLNVSMSHLVHDMISQLYSMHRSDTTQRKFSWSLSSGGLPDFVYNFTRTQDCFMHTPDGPCVLFELSHSYTDSVLTAIANVQWFLPRVTFLALSTRLPKDDIYRITPQWSDATAVTTTSGFASVRNDIQYTVTASALPMQWDPTRDCFYAPVPFDFKATNDTTHTLLCAKITTQFHEGVSYEQMSRYSIRLDICRDDDIHAADDYKSSFSGDTDETNVPWLDSRLQGFFEPHSGANMEPTSDLTLPWVPSYTSTPLSKIGHLAREEYRSNEADPSLRGGSNLNLYTGSRCEAFVGDAEPTSQSTWAQYGNGPSPTSPGKRKSLAFNGPRDATNLRVGLVRLNSVDNLNITIDAKRLKLSPLVNTDIEIDPSASYLPTRDQDDSLYAKTSEYIVPAPNHPPTQLPSPPCNANPWHKRHATHPFAISNRPNAYALPKLCIRDTAARPDSPFEELTPPPFATIDISQAQIQHNYHEFEERKRHRALEKAYYKEHVPEFDGVVSPTEIEDCAFERIFLESGSEGESECLEEV